jgi:hypothetical protein
MDFARSDIWKQRGATQTQSNGIEIVLADPVRRWRPSAF